MPAPILSRSFLSVPSASSGSDPPSLGGGDVSSSCSPLATQNFLGRDVPAPTRTINYFGVGDVPSPASHALATQNFLGRDVPAPTRTINYFGVGDVPSPASHALATQNFLGRDVPAPTRSINYFGVGDVPSPASHALATQSFLGRDVPAPTRSINYFGVGDVPSPASHALAPRTFWDEMSQPLPAASITSGLETSRLQPPTPSHPELSGTRRPSPHPDPPLLRGRATSRRPSRQGKAASSPPLQLGPE